jgi:hypothetical protein
VGFGLGRRSMHDSGILLYHFRVYGWAQAESEVGLHTSATRVERNADVRGDVRKLAPWRATRVF